MTHERVEFNERKRAQGEDINSWQTRCRQQGGKCEFCDQCTPELIRDRFIVGIKDITLITKLINSAVKEPRISLETILSHAQSYEATKTKLKGMVPEAEEQVNFTYHTTQATTQAS